MLLRIMSMRLETVTHAPFAQTFRIFRVTLEASKTAHACFGVGRVVVYLMTAMRCALGVQNTQTATQHRGGRAHVAQSRLATHAAF
jgi:hypothetical protein